MNLLTICLLGTCMQVFALGGRAQVVTLSRKNVPLQQVFREINRQTGLDFIYEMKMMKAARPVNIHVKNESVDKVLDICFDQQPFYYTRVGNSIILKEITVPKEAAYTDPPTSIPVTGKVTDNKGQPLEGATISVKGTSQAVKSDANGDFSIMTDLNSILLISFVGFEAIEVRVGSQTNIAVQLKLSASGLSDVVVVGYGTQNKRNLTSAISSISARDIQSQPIQQAGQALQGKVAGVQIIQNSGSPGSSMMIRIRGVGTVNNSEPLYVIDGNLGASPNNLDPNQIESIDVLKSASAAAIYGAQGANGVIIITTKKGVAGHSVMNFSMYTGAQQIHRKFPLTNAREYATIYNQALINGGSQPLFDNVETMGEGTDWQDAIFRTGPITNFELSASGGTEKGTYYIGGGYFKQTGTIINTDYSRVNLRVNSEYKVTPGITIGENIGLSYVVNNTIPAEFGSRSPIANAWHMDPSVPVKNADGSWGYPKFSDTKNPVAEATLIKNYSKDPVFNGNAFVALDLMKGLVFRSQINMNMGFNNAYYFMPTFDIFPLQRNLVASMTRNITQSTNWDWQNTLTLKKKLGLHGFEILGGVTAFTSRVENVSASGQDLPANANTDPDLRYLDLTTTGQVAGGAGEYGMLSFLGRVNYAYNNTYLFTGNFRVDGSSKFGNEHRFGYFPSFSVGWRISNEAFMKDIDFINDLKIRGGYGELGNQNSLSNYAFANSITRNLNYVFGDNVNQGQAATSMGNPKLKWESTKEIEVGFDFTGFGDKLSVSFDYYNRNTTNMLLQVPIATYTGIQTAPFVNGGSVNNHGFEALLSYQIKKTEKLSYNVSVNFSRNINKVTELSNTQAAIFAGNFSRTTVGEPIGAFYGYVMEGIFQTQEEVNKHAFQTTGTAPGDIKFKDLDGNNVINQNDRQTIGSPWPKLTYGVSSGVRWNHFDLYVALFGVYGNSIASEWKYFTEGSNFYNFDTYMLKAWNGEGSSNTIPRLNVNDPNNNSRYSSFYIDDGSYLRLKNVQIGYTFPYRFFNRIQNMRLYLSGQNLLTLTTYRGYDPEIGSSGSPLIVGDDWGFYPQARVITAGLSLNF
ncbi:MAG: TonB-dependent receptor [Agriterribacter sp.]